MNVLNNTLYEKIIEAEGRYLDSSGLQLLEQYLTSYATRLEAYQSLRDHSANLVLQALRRLGQDYPELIKNHGKRCQYDMSEVLRYIALSILRDDEAFFNEQMMSWLDTILVAHKRNDHCATAYHHLQDAIDASLPPAVALLTHPYLESIRTVLQSHA